MLRRVFPLVRCASQARAASAICSKLPPKFLAPALTRTKMDSKQGPQAVTGHLDMFKMGLDRKTPTSAEIEAELYEVLCNFKDYKIDRESLKLELKFVEDVGLDSLDLVEFVMVLEDHFEIEITDDEADNVHTLQDALDVLFVKMGPED
ncbi:hypothetical protein ACHWQZ_G012269 [Mnemiopsis leidyi]